MKKIAQRRHADIRTVFISRAETEADTHGYPRIPYNSTGGYPADTPIVTCCKQPPYVIEVAAADPLKVVTTTVLPPLPPHYPPV